MIERQSFSEGLTGVVDWASDAKANNGWCVKRITHCWVSLASAHVHNTRQPEARKLAFAAAAYDIARSTGAFRLRRSITQEVACPTWESSARQSRSRIRLCRERSAKSRTSWSIRAASTRGSPDRYLNHWDLLLSARRGSGPLPAARSSEM